MISDVVHVTRKYTDKPQYVKSDVVHVTRRYTDKTTIS